jgi:hypothetical protein
MQSCAVKPSKSPWAISEQTEAAISARSGTANWLASADFPDAILAAEEDQVHIGCH